MGHKVDIFTGGFGHLALALAKNVDQLHSVLPILNYSLLQTVPSLLFQRLILAERAVCPFLPNFLTVLP